MTVNYIQPDYVVERLRYYDGEFLKDEDFVAEQQYHIDRHDRHHRLLHSGGIAEGLTVTVAADKLGITIAPGTAIDDHGRQILLATSRDVPVPTDVTATMLVQMAFLEVESRLATEGTVANTRFEQKPDIKIVTNLQPGTVLLATLTIVAASNSADFRKINAVSMNDCVYAGVRLAPSPLGPPTVLHMRGDTPGATLEGNLTVAGKFQVPIGTAAIGYPSANQPGALAVKGNVGIGTLMPNQALVVQSGKASINWDGASQMATLGVSGDGVVTGKLGIGLAATATPNQALVVTTNKKASIGWDGLNQAVALGVTGDVVATGRIGIGVSAASAATPYQALVVTANNKASIGWDGASQTATLGVKGDGVVTGKLGIGLLATATPNQALVVTTGNKASIGWDGLNQAVALSVSGDVVTTGKIGIGVSAASAGTPNQALVVGGNVGIGYDVPAQTAALAVNGNVGIGTIGPYQALVVPSGKVAIGWDGYLQNVTLGVTGDMLVNGKIGLGLPAGAASPTQALVVQNGNVTIGSDGRNQTAALGVTGDVAVTGKIGIGTTAPNYALTIASGGKVAIGHNNTAQTSALAVVGNVGINVFSPSQALVVANGNVGIGYDTIQQTAALAVYGNVGIGTFAPRSALDTGAGVMSGAPNDYMKAQLALMGGGNISFTRVNGDPTGSARVKWSSRILGLSAERGVTFAEGYLQVDMPAVGKVFTATADPLLSELPFNEANRTVTADGILLKGWEALYAVHNPGGDHTMQLRIRVYTMPFQAPSNWILLAVYHFDENTIKLGTGATIPLGTTDYSVKTELWSDEAGMKTIRGYIGSNVLLVGAGWVSDWSAPIGVWVINFTKPFSGLPTITCTIDDKATTDICMATVRYSDITVSSFKVYTFQLSVSNNALLKTAKTYPFSFVAVGPR